MTQANRFTNLASASSEASYALASFIFFCSLKLTLKLVSVYFINFIVYLTLSLKVALTLAFTLVIVKVIVKVSDN